MKNKLLLGFIIIATLGFGYLALKENIQVSSSDKTSLEIADENGRLISKKKITLIRSEDAKSEFYDSRDLEACVNEVKCLWKAFLDFTTFQNDCLDCIIHKWQQPIKIKIIGSNQKIHLDAVENFIEKVRPSLPVAMTFSENPNFLIVFSDNIKHGFYVKHKSYLSNFHDWNKFEDEFQNSTLVSQLDIYDGRYLFKATPFFSEDYSFERYAVFIDINDKSWKRYLERRLFTGLGFTSNSYWMDGLSGYDLDQLGILKKKLVQILYNNKIKSGDTLSEVKEIFYEIVE